jgi:hypothetical protein
MRGLALLTLTAVALLSGCYHPGDYTDGQQRCKDDTPQICLSYPSTSKELGTWFGETSCRDSGKVCQVDKDGAASCVPP